MVKILLPALIHNEEELDGYLEDCLELGFEGIMIRDPKGKYKFGRSTVNEGILLKIKKFLDDEATLVEIVEKMINDNPLEEDELGRAKRSSHKDNKTPANTAGAVVLNWNGIVFNVGFGPGFTDVIKQTMWDQREELKGKLYKFSYQALSKDGIPRFGKLMNRLDIISGNSPEFCCGAMCPRQEVQIRIDRMQAVIDISYEHLCYGGPVDIEALKLELSSLQSTD